MKITLDKLRELNACDDAVAAFMSQTETDAVKLLRKMLRLKKWTNSQGNVFNTLIWANWLVVRLLGRKGQIRYAVYAAKQVIGIFEVKFPNDERPRKALEAAKRCIVDDTPENRAAAAAATAAAYDAVWAAEWAPRAAASASVTVWAAASAASVTGWAAASAASVTGCTAENAEGAAMKTKIIRYGIKLLAATGKEEPNHDQMLDQLAKEIAGMSDAEFAKNVDKLKSTAAGKEGE